MCSGCVVTSPQRLKWKVKIIEKTIATLGKSAIIARCHGIFLKDRIDLRED
jgi:hypothetical protein